MAFHYLHSWPIRCCSENIAGLNRSLFHGDWFSEISFQKVHWRNYMAANFNVRKIYSTVERMDGCEYPNSIFERKDGWNELFLEIIALLLKKLLKQRMTASSPFKINLPSFKEWMTAILSVTKTDTLLQGMAGWLQLEW